MTERTEDALYTETLGSGPDLVMLHGWGMHSGIWRETAERLAERFRVTLVDLPGHGRSAPGDGPFDIHRVAARVAEVAPEEAAWLGWSLGGMIALLAAADRPERVSKLILVASSPRFVQDEGWPCALDPEVLNLFWYDLERSYAATLTRFLALQTRGAENASETLRRMRSRLFRHGDPDPQALRGGLRILRDIDLRPLLDQIGCPTLLLQGERDTLVPRAAAEETAKRIHQARLEVIRGAGHAPFLSHPEAFEGAVVEFLSA